MTLIPIDAERITTEAIQLAIIERNVGDGLDWVAALNEAMDVAGTQVGTDAADDFWAIRQVVREQFLQQFPNPEIGV